MRDPAIEPAPASVRTPRASLITPSPSPRDSMGPQADRRQSPQQGANPAFPLPKLRLEVRDLTHRGADTFLASVHAGKALAISVQSVLGLLYEFPGSKTTTPPPTRSVTLVLRPMDGIAYTTGIELDSDHKEIHISLDYILGIDTSRSSHEILGVLTHEVVHCFQYNAFGTCPGGLIEGVADWVRMHSGLSPPHWQRKAGEKWDAGYEHTGFFLEYLETRFGEGLVRRLNEKLRIEKYEEKRFWMGLCGRPIEQLWADYKEVVEKERREKERSEKERREKERRERGRRDADECMIVEKGDTAEPERQTTPMVH